MVFAAGLTEGLLLVEVNPEGLLVQLYVSPITEVFPISVELPLHIAVAEPAEADGSALMVILLEVVSTQPFPFFSIICTEPEPEVLPHSTVILLVPAPEVTVPPVTFHE